jgi:hypothetical protein
MKLSDLIQIANEHYDDEYLAMYFDFDNDVPALSQGQGDTLAMFVVAEIADTFDPDADDDDQLREAIRVMEAAARQLQVVANGLASVRVATLDSRDQSANYLEDL